MSSEQNGAAETLANDETTPVEPTEYDDRQVAENPVTPTAEELGEGTVEGAEGTDEGFAAALAAEQPTAEEQPAADGVGQTADALLSTRGTTLANEARRIAGFTNRATSYYSYTTYMNEETGTRRTDCTGLMSYILKRKSLSGYNLIPDGGNAHPLSEDFYDYFASRPTTANTGTSARWRRIVYAMSLKPGDIIVYKYSSTSSTGTTGHTMMVKELPTRGSRSGEILVKVVDSARSGHADDTRGSSFTGPGTGTLGIKVDSSGKPVGYYWKGGISTSLNTTKLVFGRLE